MPNFKIVIESNLEGYVNWETRFYDDDKYGDADVVYITNIARELQTAVKKIQEWELRHAKRPMIATRRFEMEETSE